MAALQSASPPLHLLLLSSSISSYRNIHPLLFRKDSKSQQPLFLTNRNSLSLNFLVNPNLNHRTRSITATSSSLRFPLVAPQDHWGVWTALLTTAVVGLWSEKTNIGRMISDALVSILLGLVASNVGIIPHEAPSYAIVMDFLLPLAIPLLLFRADLRNVMRSTGKLLLAFLFGSVATIVGTLVAFLIVPMRSLGQDSWKIASALMASYIGGAINYVAVSKALGVSPSVVAAGVAADNVICAIYFIALFALSSKVPQESSTSTTGECGTCGAWFWRLAPCATDGHSNCCFLTYLLGIHGGYLPGITATIVVLAALLPKQFGCLAPAGDAVAVIFMQVFFPVLGASGSIWNVINIAPSIFMFAFIQVTVHPVVILGMGKLFHKDLKLLLLASNANIGGPTTACGMATAKGWDSLIVPGIHVGIFGISISTFLGIIFGTFVLKRM